MPEMIRGRSVTFIVETHLGYDRPDQFVTPEWIDFRLDWFHRFTVKSLQNQTFKPAAIFVQCGERHRPRLEAYHWSPDVTICWFNGQEEYAKIDTDYLVTTRIDSDDLFHRDCLAEVRSRVRFSNKREVLAWKTRIVWDYINGYVTNDHSRPSVPFFTHVFPRAIYKSWPLMLSQHFIPQGIGGAGDHTAMPLSRNRVCVVKHGWNHSVLKFGKTWPVLKTKADVEAHELMLKQRNPEVKLYFGKEIIAKTLEPFGVTLEMIP